MTELQQRMSISDYALLRLYRAKRGPLNPILRNEAGHALLASVMFNSQGVKKRDGTQFSPADFMPWAADEAEQECASPDEVMSLFMSLAKPKRKDH